MLNKPKGVVSATSDSIHSTVIDLLNLPEKHELHIAGRLDFNTTGLLLLTNDGAWSRTITSPDNHIQKVYRVTLKDSVDDAMLQQYRHVFAQGIFLSPENITTRPATLVQLSDNTVELTITEGRYHQVKRMFGFFKNEVIELHRQAIGKILLDDRLPSGESRQLTYQERSTFGN